MHGGSGGPLVVPVSGGYKLAGIVSWGSSRCDTYGAYTRVSIFENWIEINTGISIGYRPPSPEGDTIICKGVESSKYSIINLGTALDYEWKVLPDDAGFISGNSENVTVYWNPGYDGLVTVMLRVTINNKVSDWASLKVKVIKKTKLLSQSDDAEMCAGQSINFNVEAEGYNLNYKWFQNDSLIQSGTSGQMNISSTNTYDSGNYTTEISGSCGTVFSSIRMKVHPLTRITYISPDITVQTGDNATLEVNAEGHDLIYQWQKDDELPDNSNASQYLLQNVNAKNIGLYLTTVTGTCGADTSNKVYVYVKKEGSNDTEVFIWPTVTSNEFNVALSNNAYYNVLIFNTMGQLLRKQINCQYQATINVNTLPKGIYIINVFNKEFRKSIKLIKE